jgi:trigger factor
MQVTETQADGLKREYKVQIAADEIDEKMAARLEELGNTVKVPGFRPGKVPLLILKQRFGKSVLGEVLERAVSDSSSQALSERGLRPAMRPKIEISAFDEGKDLEYTMALELFPDIEPMEFSKLELERSNIQIEDSAVQETLEDLAKAHKKTEPLEAPRKTQGGDVLVIDFSGTVDGEAYPGMAAKDHHLELGSSSFIEGFEEQLLGAEIGETRAIKVTFPEAYANDRLAGQEAVFTVTVQNILASVPLSIDDELATTLGETDLEALKSRIRARLAAEYKEFGRTRLKRQLLDHLAEGHDFPVPEGMVDTEFATIWRQVEQDREAGRLDSEDVDKSEEELKEEYRTIAERRVRLGLLISEVGRRNGIEVTQEEADMAMLREAQGHPGKEREVFEYFQKTPEAMANLRAPLFEDKVVDFIIDLADVTDRTVTVEEIRKEIDSEAQEGASKAKEKPAKAKKAVKSANQPGAKKKQSGAKKKAAKKSS